jgi:hypothetical protein
MPLPKHYGVELDLIYANRREMSDILTLNRKLFEKLIIEYSLISIDPKIINYNQIIKF